jgi:hypothetical protein
VDPEFKKKMQNDLGTMKRNLKDFIFREGNRGMRLFDPNMDLRGMEEDNIWGDDPVHPRSETYMKIAKGIVRQAGALEDKQPAKRKRADSLEASQQPVTSRTGRGRGGGGQSSTPFQGSTRGLRGSRGGGNWAPRGSGGRGYGGGGGGQGYGGYPRGRGFY